MAVAENSVKSYSVANLVSKKIKRLVDQNKIVIYADGFEVQNSKIYSLEKVDDVSTIIDRDITSRKPKGKIEICIDKTYSTIYVEFDHKDGRMVVLYDCYNMTHLQVAEIVCKLDKPDQ